MKRNLLLVSFAVLIFTVSTAFTKATTRVATSVGYVSADVSPTPSPSPKITPPPPKSTPTTKEDDEIIKIDTELVNLDVRVIDRNNRSINNLQQKDFKIFEDGNLQQIDFFSKSEVPTNYALVVDTSGSLREQLEKVIEAGNVLVGTNKPDDETMIIRFVGRDKISIDQPFTGNKEDLNYALDNFYVDTGQTAIRDAVYLAVEEVQRYEASKKADDRKRRALVVVTDGEDRDSFYTEKQLFDLLRESTVQIYIIGFIDELEKEKGFIGKSKQEKARSFLERLASESGGKAYFPASSSELPTLAKEISNELRTQYSIGYIPSNDKKDGTYRNIRVTVADGPKAEKRIAITRAGRTADGPAPKIVLSPSPLLSPSPTPATK